MGSVLLALALSPTLHRIGCSTDFGQNFTFQLSKCVFAGFEDPSHSDGTAHPGVDNTLPDAICLPHHDGHHAAYFPIPWCPLRQGYFLVIFLAGTPLGDFLAATLLGDSLAGTLLGDFWQGFSSHQRPYTKQRRTPLKLQNPETLQKKPVNSVNWHKS